MFGIYAGTDPKDAKELMTVATAELAAATENLTEQDLARAKAQMKVSLLMALENSSSRAEQLARQTLAFGNHLKQAT